MGKSTGWLIALFLLIFTLGANLGGGAFMGERKSLEDMKREEKEKEEGQEEEKKNPKEDAKGPVEEKQPGEEEKQAGEANKQTGDGIFTSPVIAHALGGFDYYPYLNSPVGFEEAYQLGCRLFEVDLTKTSDGVWVCRHGWTDPMGQWEGEARRLSLSEFIETPLYGKYETLTYEGLLSLMEAYPDASFILDTKNYSLSSFSYVRRDYQDLIEQTLSAGKEALLDRLVPEIYNEAMFYGIDAMHAFPSYLYSFWEKAEGEDLESIALFCKEQGIGAVCLGYELQDTQDMLPFTQRGIPVYFFTVNDEAVARHLIEEGATGVVSDFLVGRIS